MPRNDPEQEPNISEEIREFVAQFPEFKAILEHGGMTSFIQVPDTHEHSRIKSYIRDVKGELEGDKHRPSMRHKTFESVNYEEEDEEDELPELV